jgi:hypothetical protein
MASVKDVEQVADDLEKLVGELRSELQDGPDFGKLTQIADEISEHADHAAETFSSVNETLMSRIGELTGGRSRAKSGQRSSSGGQSREKSKASQS